MTAHARRQCTIKNPISVDGVGFITGTDVRLTFKPAPPHTGVVFVRTDLDQPATIPARVANVVQRSRRTTLTSGKAAVEMVEHVLAALAGLHVDNCIIETSAGETPGCDGSSQPFVERLLAAGIEEQKPLRPATVVRDPVCVSNGDCMLAAHPGPPDKLIISYNLDYGPDTPIGSQSFFVDVSPDSFRSELAPSRTFVLQAEADALRKQGIGTRATARDLLVFGPRGVIDNSLRFPDECVRHKILDIVGDLSLLGTDLHAHVVAHKSGHQLNAELVRRLIRQHEPSSPTKPDLPVFDIQQIMRILPHRYPFLLIDRVLELDEERRAIGIKNVTYNEPFFQGHWPGRPIMPGVMIVEAMAQLAGVLLSRMLQDTGRLALILSMNNIKLRRPVVPGDQLRLEVRTVRAKARTANVEAQAHVEGQLAAEARIRFVIVDAEPSENFDHQEQTLVGSTA